MPSQTPSVPDRPRLRAGDADRDATLTVIQDAFVNGRLTPAEVAERQDRALTSQYTDELLPIVADLPAPGAIPVALPDAPAEPSAAFQPADAAPVTAETPGPVPAAARKNAKA